MVTVILVIHIVIAVALIGTVLLQRSEGGALGIGGGSGGFVTGRSAANMLTRTTAILAAAFFATSIVLAVLAGDRPRERSILEAPPATQGAPAVPRAPTAPLSQ